MFSLDEKMFGLQFMNVFCDSTKVEEMNVSTRSIPNMRKIFSKGSNESPTMPNDQVNPIKVIEEPKIFSKGSKESPTMPNDQVNPIKVIEEQTSVKTDSAVKSLHGQTSKKTRPNGRVDKKSSRFQNELEKTARRVYQERASCKEEDDETFEFITGVERWAQEGEVKPTNTKQPSLKHGSRPRPRARNLERDLQMAKRLLEIERSQKSALQDRLEDVENQMSSIRKSQLKEEQMSQTYSQQIQKLQEEVQGCREELDKERLRSKQMEEDLENARRENQKCQERMRILMFHHIPSVSPRFKDIGPVDYSIEEQNGRVGDYELGKTIGEGHYGMVQVGTNTRTHQSYAIKVLAKDRVQRFKDLQQMAMEVHVLKRYPHPNIVHLHEVIHATDSIYLATELCVMDIHQYHNDIGLSEEGAKEVILGILRPLRYLHSHGICHLDLKPENILLARSVDLQNVTHEHVRLCDFGLVNMAKKPEQSKQVIRQGYACGTPGFFAPEMILKREFEGRLADMWSLGCIIMELTLGFTQPWIDSYELIDSNPNGFRDGLEGCLREIPRENYPHHQNLLDIIHACLTIAPEQRISSKHGLNHPWLASIAIADENRQDSAHTRQECGSPYQYTERYALVADSAVYC